VKGQIKAHIRAEGISVLISADLEKVQLMDKIEEAVTQILDEEDQEEDANCFS